MPDRINKKDNCHEKLQALMKVLRQECPWDREQTLHSLRRYTLEEAYEVIEAVELADQKQEWQPLKHELGDLLLQILFYACIAEEENEFSFEDVIQSLIEKMIYRHPHVFASAKPDDLMEQWDSLKDSEHPKRHSLMDDIPPLPALAYAQKQQQRVARVGFDWNHTSDVMRKMREEMDELEHEIQVCADIRRVEDEFGDVLFTMTNLARKLGIDAELCLMQSNRKFERRFRAMEKLAEDREHVMKNMTLEALDRLYEEAKKAVSKQEEK